MAVRKDRIHRKGAKVAKKTRVLPRRHERHKVLRTLILRHGCGGTHVSRKEDKSFTTTTRRHNVRVLGFQKEEKQLRSARCVVVFSPLLFGPFFRPPCRNDAISKNPSLIRCHPWATGVIVGVGLAPPRARQALPLQNTLLQLEARLAFVASR